MVQLLAVMATDAEHMPSLLYSLRHVLQCPNAEGSDVWGLGYYADNRALTKRKPGGLLEDRTFFELASDVRSSVIVASVHGNAKETQHAPPFRFRRWLFSPSGDISALASLRAKILDALPGFIRSEIREASPGELAFGMFLRELHDKGVLDDPTTEGTVLASALSRTNHAMKMLAEEAGIDVPSVNFAATNGRVLLASRRGPALHWRRQEGLEAVPEGPLDDDLHNVQLVVEALKRFRAVIVCAGMDAPSADWTAVPEDAVLWTDRSLQTGEVSG